ncbi:hypothetical protein QBC46DRAFT_336123 [Diplogelasinospora grovesii]|uniref:Uncharacterized protein n=1 Tax=Diplogelasinospora grovesii TaxID=303347 RepID=A0AAN6NJH5_9PEZI|nr:hypothetical protein QBC46DRAFT_336123 [Diplogelasinospora grovesii]
MAQGGSIKTPKPTGNPVKAAGRASKKGVQKKTPQRAKNKTTADKLQKKFSAGMAARTEAMLGARAGHLELIGKGKKDKSNEAGKVKGGSKKFG